MANVVIIRGLPGSGKTTVARSEFADHFAIAADDYFTVGDRYEYDRTRIRDAHEWAIGLAQTVLLGNVNVVIHNTFTARWEIDSYLRPLVNAGFDRLTIISLFDAGMTDEGLAARCVHGVGVETIAKMRDRWEW
jgi:hypothetical protein